MSDSDYYQLMKYYFVDKLLIFNVELVENELILEFIVNTDKPDVVILPITFNVVLQVAAPYIIVVPLRYRLPLFNDKLPLSSNFNVVAPFNFVVPLTFKLLRLV